MIIWNRIEWKNYNIELQQWMIQLDSSYLFNNSNIYSIYNSFNMILSDSIHNAFTVILFSIYLSKQKYSSNIIQWIENYRKSISNYWDWITGTKSP